jgi:hypothetical protein
MRQALEEEARVAVYMNYTGGKQKLSAAKYCSYTRARAHTHIHTYIHIYTYIYVYVDSSKFNLGRVGLILYLVVYVNKPCSPRDSIMTTAKK